MNNKNEISKEFEKAAKQEFDGNYKARSKFDEEMAEHLQDPQPVKINFPVKTPQEMIRALQTNIDLGYALLKCKEFTRGRESEYKKRIEKWEREIKQIKKDYKL